MAIFKETIRIDQVRFLQKGIRIHCQLLPDYLLDLLPRTARRPVHNQRALVCPYIVVLWLFSSLRYRIFKPLWAMIRPWLDPTTREKFHVLGSNLSALQAIGAFRCAQPQKKLKT
jgi:hypothetical protein